MTYITAEKVKEQYGITKKSLTLLRNNRTLVDVKKQLPIRGKGVRSKNFLYNPNEIERKLFIKL